jgi:hypothetical protein
LRQFVEIVDAALLHRGVASRLDNGVIDVPSEGLRIGLSNLAQVCAKTDPAKWMSLVEAQLDRSVGLAKKPLAELIANFEAVRERIKPRFRSFGVPLGSWNSSRAFADGLAATLVADLPDRVQEVMTTDLQRWGISDEGAWEQALKNLELEGLPPHPQRYVLERPVRFSFYHSVGDSMFVAAQALCLAKIDSSAPRHGWLVLVPNRHHLFFAGIEDLPQCGAAVMMLSHGAPRFLDGPGSISDQLYWTDGIRFECLRRPAAMTGTEIVASVTDSVRLLAGTLPR